MNKKLTTVTIMSLLALLFLAIAYGWDKIGGKGACKGGMCTIPGAELTEPEVRQRASTFAYDRLVSRQKSGAAITGPDGKPIRPQPIESDSWQVSRNDAGWRLKRHLTRDLWQIVECNTDGSSADAFFEVGPPLER